MEQAKHRTPRPAHPPLRPAEVAPAGGQPVARVSRTVGASEQTYCRWREAYGGVRADQATRPTGPGRGNARAQAAPPRPGWTRPSRRGGRGKRLSPAGRRAAVTPTRAHPGRGRGSDRRAGRVPGHPRFDLRTHSPTGSSGGTVGAARPNSPSPSRRTCSGTRGGPRRLPAAQVPRRRPAPGGGWVLTEEELAEAIRCTLEWLTASDAGCTGSVGSAGGGLLHHRSNTPFLDRPDSEDLSASPAVAVGRHRGLPVLPPMTTDGDGSRESTAHAGAIPHACLNQGVGGGCRRVRASGSCGSAIFTAVYR